MESYAILPAHSKGREYPEEPSNYRSVFQRDRDRILHCGSFRKLQFKTQVFLENKGDYYRTRLTHTLEVAQIARTVSKVLGVNSELAEAIALAHDLGHPPFGHAGEEELNKLLINDGGFDHNIQTLKIVTKLEQMYASHPGLNLTIETLDGIIKHNGPLNIVNKYITEEIKDLKKFNFKESPSIEAQIATISDDIAYNSHDLGDGLRAGFFSLSDIKSLPIVREAFQEVEIKYKSINYKTKCYEIIRYFLNNLVTNVIDESSKRLNLIKDRNLETLKNEKLKLIDFNKNTKQDLEIIRKYLFENMYRSKEVIFEREKCSEVIVDLFNLYNNDLNLLPSDWQKKIKYSKSESPKRIIGDYISGMTDRFAINQHKVLVN
ncbi:MAG: deoxyguanosinetriphosphate triphosphohydrolase [Pseudomonadota bacterium]|nr:deoxyguanosinetriphosphate triphosphohydrolase [Pseudomonadota bacterium]